VCLLGDGAFAHTWSELETAVREHLPITIVLLNNAVLGYQKHAELHLLGAYTRAVELSRVDHAAIAAACGAAAIHVRDPADLADALREAIETDGPVLVEVDTDPDAYPPISAWEGSAGLSELGRVGGVQRNRVATEESIAS
jgi:acetolactate synthase-1/2/3 large subunit